MFNVAYASDISSKLVADILLALVIDLIYLDAAEVADTPMVTAVDDTTPRINKGPTKADTGMSYVGDALSTN